MSTLTDLFAGGGGTTTGAMQVPGVEVTIAANHLKLVMEIHAANHPNTDHAVVDLHKERPSFFPKTDMLWASPECTKWSQASGAQLPAIEEGLFADPFADDVKQQSRLLMFDVLRYVEHHRYRVVMVENVVDIATQAKYRTAWTIWRQELRALGYQWRVVSLNSMHAQTFGSPAPQSRDRIYVVAWPEGERAPELDRILRPRAYCPKCDVVVESVQSFKTGRTVGRYRQAYLYCCSRCGVVVEPGWLPADIAIDWSLPGLPFGHKKRAPKTRMRLIHGIARYWGPLTVEAAGNTYDATSPQHPRHGELDAYYRAWSVSDPLGALQATNTKALAVPVEGRDGKEALPMSLPARTQTTRNETGLAYTPFVSELYGTAIGRPVTEPAATFTAGGNHHALVMSYYSRDDAMRPARESLSTVTTEPRHALVTRHNGGGAEMTTLADEYLRTLTTGGNVSLTRRPADVTVADLKAAEKIVDDVLFRMFEPHEVAAGMAFPPDYIWQPEGRAKPISKRALVKAMGNAVTPPSSRDIVQVVDDSLGVAA